MDGGHRFRHSGVIGCKEAFFEKIQAGPKTQYSLKLHLKNAAVETASSIFRFFPAFLTCENKHHDLVLLAEKEGIQV